MRGRTLLLGGLLGALIAYYLDPAGGSKRRSKAGTLLRSGSQTAQQGVQAVGSKTQGMVRETVMHAPDNPNPDDNTLRDRIESELFRDPKYSREHLNLMVVGGVVELNGQLDSQSDIDTVVERIGGMRNVRGVQNYLHLPGTPAPNKEESLEASS
jgi:osmotically-inducible protein OsmY